MSGGFLPPPAPPSLDDDLASFYPSRPSRNELRLVYSRPRDFSPPLLSSNYDDNPPYLNPIIKNIRTRPLLYIEPPARFSSPPPTSHSEHCRTSKLLLPYSQHDEDDSSEALSSNDSFSSRTYDFDENVVDEPEQRKLGLPFLRHDEDDNSEARSGNDSFSSRTYDFDENVVDEQEQGFDEQVSSLPPLPHDDELETEEQDFSSFESSNDAPYSASPENPIKRPFRHFSDEINASLAALQFPQEPTIHPSPPTSFTLPAKPPPIEVPTAASPPLTPSIEDLDETLHYPFPPSTSNFQTPVRSTILSPEPGVTSESQDASFPTADQQTGRPIYFKGNADEADVLMETNRTPDDSQYNSSYAQFDNSENFQQDHDSYASIRDSTNRVPYALDSEIVPHWSDGSSSVSSDTSSIALSRNVPITETSASVSDPNRSLETNISGNQTNGLQGQPSHMYERDEPSPSQKSYSLSSNVSYASTTSIQHTPQISQSRTQPPPFTHTPFSQAHLKPGNNASLLSYKKTLEMYRMQARKMSGDLEIQFEFAVFLVGLGDRNSQLTPDEGNENGNEEEQLVEEACRILKRLSAQGHAASQYYLATCYINGLGSASGYKQDWAKAFPLLQKASKHNHPDAAYLAAKCYVAGKGVKRDGSRALQYYKKSAAAAHPGAMYALGMAFLTGNLVVLESTPMTGDLANQVTSVVPPLPIRPAPRIGVKWLKRACESATPDFSDALFELARLHEQGIDNVLFVDLPYAVTLYTRAAELGHVRSMYRLGECYEFGKLGCELDPRRSVAWYRVAAESEHPDSCFAMTAWYLSGHPGVVPQSGTEAFRWALKAAEKGHPKASYATAYFMETGMGVEKDMDSAMKWYKVAADLGDLRAVERLAMGNGNELGGMVGERGKYGKDRRKGDDCIVM